jgi:hypothetical protein
LALGTPGIAGVPRNAEKRVVGCIAVPLDMQGQGQQHEDAEYRRLKSKTVLDDLLLAVYEVRFIAPFVVLSAIVIAYQLFIAPYQVEIQRVDPKTIDLVSTIRHRLQPTQPTTLSLNTEQTAPSADFSSTTIHSRQCLLLSD